MNIFVTGDTHGNISKIKRFCKSNKDSLLIILGDFGFVWDYHSEDNLNKISQIAKKSNNIISFIDGNHENFEKLNRYDTVDWMTGNVSFLRENIIHLHRGQIFFIDNISFFTLGGARSIDKQSRTAFVSWWPEEDISFVNLETSYKNLSENNFKIDFVFTHTCPKKFKGFMNLPSQYSDSNETSLDFILDKTDFKSWYFGHFHVDTKTIIDNKDIFCVYNKIIQIH